MDTNWCACLKVCEQNLPLANWIVDHLYQISFFWRKVFLKNIFILFQGLLLYQLSYLGNVENFIESQKCISEEKILILLQGYIKRFSKLQHVTPVQNWSCRSGPETPVCIFLVANNLQLHSLEAPQSLKLCQPYKILWATVFPFSVSTLKHIVWTHNTRVLQYFQIC